MKEHAYSFLSQYPTSAVECILVDLSMSCGVVSLQFDLLVNQSYLELYMDKNMQKMANIYSIKTTAFCLVYAQKGKNIVCGFSYTRTNRHFHTVT